ncbi:hypothetical protein ACPCVO_36060 [Streptomyces umbrinus]|uniref:hypothetical protein n=1 Tax=Streptomyces umbrinus TaxID=67370 RepID=UPI003C2AED4C
MPAEISAIRDKYLFASGMIGLRWQLEDADSSNTFLLAQRPNLATPPRHCDGAMFSMLHQHFREITFVPI